MIGNGTGRADMTLDGERVTPAALAREWGIKRSRILASYARHQPTTRQGLREAIQHDLAHRVRKAPPHGGSLAWGLKSRESKDFPKSLNCEGLRARLLARGVELPDLPGCVTLKIAG